MLGANGFRTLGDGSVHHLAHLDMPLASHDEIVP
jgi:hypothetical protein